MDASGRSWGAFVNTIPLSDVGAVNSGLQAEFDVAWKTVTSHGRFVGGPEVAQFEDEFARYCNSAHCVGVANGTDALELILSGLGIGRGDEVIVPANAFVSTAEAVCAVGARPRFVDVDPDTLLIDPSAAAAAVGAATAAIVAVHQFGQMADLHALLPLTNDRALALVEDATCAPGARLRGQPAGSIGRAAAFGFHPGAQLGALGDGGAVVTSDRDLAERIRVRANHGRHPSRTFQHDESGRHSRLDTVQAALLSVKLAHLDAHNDARRRVWDRYLRRLPQGCLPVSIAAEAEAVHHRAVVRVDDRDAAIAALIAADVAWGIHYPVPCHWQPAFAEFDEVLPVAEASAHHVLSLPMGPTIADWQVDRVCEALRAATWPACGHAS